MRYRQSDDRASTHTAVSVLSATLIVAGIALRLWQYLGRSALWTDEAALANNIVSRPIGELLMTPLAIQQAAPGGFLLVERSLVAAFGPSELALRAFPVLCSILALLLLWSAARRLLPDETIPLVLAPFALAPPLIFFGTEVKQYSSDVAIGLALFVMALRLEPRALTTRRILASMAAGAIAVWFSQTAVLVVAGLGAAMLIDALATRDRGGIVRIATIVCVWGASALASTLVALERLPPGTQKFMHNFWADGFWPLSLAHPSSVTWPFRQIARMISEQLALPVAVAVPAGVCVIAALWLTWRRDRRTAMLLAAPLVVTLGASAAQLYPFRERLVLFLIPSLLLLIALGFTELARSLRSERRFVLAAAGATLLVLAMDARALRAAPPVYRREEITPMMAYLQQHRRPTDALYVYYGAVPAFQFYAARDSMTARSYALGGCHRGDSRSYLSELDAFRGRARVWVLFAHDQPRLRERELMTGYLADIGVLRDTIVGAGRDVDGAPTRTSLYLYDLSDSTRLRSVDAARFRAAPQPDVDPRLRCAADIT
jgi:uncharacterized membrane protein